MAEDLQGLLNRIQSDGLQKAEEERAKIIAAAKEKAAEMLADAQNQADALVKKAQADADASEEKARATIQQAARDILNSLKAELLLRLQRLTKECAGQAMSPALMAQLINQMAAAFAKNPSAEGIEVMLSAKELAEMESALKAALLSDLRSNTRISVGNDISAGLKVGFNGEDVFLDFTDDALSEIICDFVGPKLAALLKA